MAVSRICSIDGCCKPACNSRGWCVAHYSRWRRYGDPLAGRVPHGEASRWLLDHVTFSSDDCLIWPFARMHTGYGRVWLNGRLQVASRAMCELAHGNPPSRNYYAAHSCGKGRDGCVNPKHLSWKTRLENEADKRAHGTVARGEKNGRAKLSDADVMRIRELAGAVPQKELAAMFGVSPSLISMVIAGHRRKGGAR